MLSGGADLIKLDNGQWVFMEFNFGSESAFMDPLSSPIDGNLFLSKLQGQPTPLLKWLEDAYANGISAQREVLKSRKNEKDDAFDKASIDDLALSEVALYFRDRYLDDWQKDPTAENARKVLRQLRALFKDIGRENNRDLPQLIKGAENFINRQLAKSSRR